MALILVTEEAIAALKNKPPTDRRLVQIMNGYDTSTLPTSEESRLLAALLLQARGHIFNKAPKDKS